MPAYPYDPYATPTQWWQQQAPRRPVQFGQPAPPTRQPQPKQWWEGMPGPKGQSASQWADMPTSQPASLLDMLMKSGGTSGRDRPSLGPIPSMGLANMPASMWEQVSGLYGGRR